MCMVLAENEQQAYAWRLLIENLGEEWRCESLTEAGPAYALLTARPWSVAMVCAGEEGCRLLTALRERPSLWPPWLLSETPCAWADGLITLAEVERLPSLLETWQREVRLPRLALMRHGQMVCLARGLMATLMIPDHLRAWQFLPDMAALAVVHPPLMTDLRGRLYTLTARRYGLTTSAVERRLRLAIESTWSEASLSTLERFFGHSVDPERGKPTNREFLFRVQERLMLAARRIA